MLFTYRKGERYFLIKLFNLLQIKCVCLFDVLCAKLRMKLSSVRWYKVQRYLVLYLRFLGKHSDTMQTREGLIIAVYAL